jgi:Pyruvate/2-oxoacid:ferredoxin oxidoreductase delta subunit
VPDVYRRLAKRLDRLPQGFPSTPDGIELQILRRIFSPEDAAVALRLRPWPESPARIARRLRRTVEATRSTLEEMAARGQILSCLDDEIQQYALAPYVVGIYEFQVNHLDAELVRLFQAYYPYFVTRAWNRGPALARVIPVHSAIRAELSILPYEDLRLRITEARSFVIRECICRKERGIAGKPCRHPVETCLQLSRQEGAFDHFTYAGRVIDRVEALEILDRTETAGLIHATYNFREDPVFVCNCCPCCCGFLRGVREFQAPFVLARSNFVATVDAERCAACGRCAGGRCPMGAIRLDGRSAQVAADRCIGCGVCSAVCSRQAVGLVRRAPAEQQTPARDIVDWSLERYGERAGPLIRTGVRLVRRLRS